MACIVCRQASLQRIRRIRTRETNNGADKTKNTCKPGGGGGGGGGGVCVAFFDVAGMLHTLILIVRSFLAAVS